MYADAPTSRCARRRSYDAGSRRQRASGFLNEAHTAQTVRSRTFLTDGGIIDGIVDAIAPRPGQAMVEIGPGLAALTQPLVNEWAG